MVEFIGLNENDFCTLPIYEDSQPCINIIQAKTVPFWVEYIAVPIHFIHDQIFLERIVIQNIGTNLNLNDLEKEPNSSPAHFCQYDHIIGVQFYQPKGSAHTQLLVLDLLDSPHSNNKVNQNEGLDLEEIERSAKKCWFRQFNPLILLRCLNIPRRNSCPQQVLRPQIYAMCKNSDIYAQFTYSYA